MFDRLRIAPKRPSGRDGAGGPGAPPAADAWARRWAGVLVASLAMAGCTPSSPPPEAAPPAPAWQEFEGTWTAAGDRHTIRLGADRRASIGNFRGSLLLAGASRPSVGFLAEALVLNDSATGMVGRAVWTDDRGDQVFSELRGESTATGNRVAGSFLGGTGRYAGAAGSYEFSWRFVLDSEDGAVQGQSMGLKGRVRVGLPPSAPDKGASQP